MVDVINTIDKIYKYKIMSNIQLPGSNCFYSHILMNSCTPKNDFSMAKEFQKHLSKKNCKHGVIDQGKYGKISSKRK